MNITLVSANDGIIQAIRMVSLSPDFTRKFHGAIRRQAGLPFDQSGYNHRLNEIFRKYQTKDLLKRDVAQCKGGA